MVSWIRHSLARRRASSGMLRAKTSWRGRHRASRSWPERRRGRSVMGREEALGRRDVRVGGETEALLDEERRLAGGLNVNRLRNVGRESNEGLNDRLEVVGLSKG
jgi:hypothetical protein